MGRGIGSVQHEILSILVKHDGCYPFKDIQYPYPIERWGEIPKVIYTLHARGLVTIEWTEPRRINTISLRGTVIHITDAGKQEHERAQSRFTSSANGSRQLDWVESRKGH